MLRSVLIGVLVMIPSLACAFNWHTSPDGTFEYTDRITIQEYVAYLNEDDTPSGPRFDYCGWFHGGNNAVIPITRSGNSGTYTYTATDVGEYKNGNLLAFMAMANFYGTGASVHPDGYQIPEILQPKCADGLQEEPSVRPVNANYWIMSRDEYDIAITGVQTLEERTDTHAIAAYQYWGVKRSDGINLESRQVAMTYFKSGASDVTFPPTYFRLSRRIDAAQCP